VELEGRIRSAVRTGESFDRRILAPLGLALGGIIVILAPQGLAVAGGKELLGAAMAFASALTYATLLLRAKKILHGISSSALMVIEYGVASIVLAPFVAHAYWRGDVPSSGKAYAALITLGVVHTAFSGLLFLGGLRRVRTDHVAILTYVEPASAVVFAAIFLGQQLTAPTIAGGVMVVLGGLLVARLVAPGGPEPLPIEAAGEHGDDAEAPDGNTPDAIPERTTSEEDA
jgi:drug/metabolite transporter (DMT)-like permease